MSLNCGHSFCKQCVTKMFKVDSIECPMDKRVLKYENLQAVVTNYALLDITCQGSKEVNSRKHKYQMG